MKNLQAFKNTMNSLRLFLASFFPLRNINLVQVVQLLLLLQLALLLLVVVIASFHISTASAAAPKPVSLAKLRLDVCAAYKVRLKNAIDNSAVVTQQVKDTLTVLSRPGFDRDPAFLATTDMYKYLTWARDQQNAVIMQEVWTFSPTCGVPAL